MDNQKIENSYKKRKKVSILPLIVFLVAIYVFLQAYLMNANKVDIIKASEGYINDSIISQGIVCREEFLLTKNSSGVVDYLIKDGERVSKGHKIAEVYPSYDDLNNLIYLKSRQKALDDIKIVESYIDGNVLDISNTRKQLSSQMSQLSSLTSTEDFNHTLENLNDLIVSLNKIGVSTGKITDFSEAKRKIQSEIDTIQAKIPRPIDTMNSPYTGFFLRTVDGYENVATVEKFINMSYAEGMQMINSTSEFSASDNEYGKIITDYKWNVCTYLDKEQANKLREGKSIKISLDVNSNEYHKAVVEQIIDKGDKVLVVIECTDMDSIAATTRVTDCEILFKQYDGIKIPKTAIKFDSEQTMGVYVNFSNVVKFKKISPVYEDENYVIVPSIVSSENQVKLHDSIIVKGRNLYDGKYL